MCVRCLLQGFSPQRFQRADAQRDRGGLKSSPTAHRAACPARSCIRGASQGARAAPPDPPQLSSEPWRGGAGPRRDGSERALGRACLPQVFPAFSRRPGPVGRGAGRAREEHGEEPGLRRRPRQSGAPAARRLRPGRRAAEDAGRNLHGHECCAGGSSRGLGLRDHGQQGCWRQRHGVSR